MSRPIRNLTRESFARYGILIEHDPAGSPGFQIVLAEEEAVGWRLAVNHVTDRTSGKVARHPNSMESFEPVWGVTLLIVADENPEQYEVFLLDKPVCLKRNIWHAVICLSESSMVKIAENLEVDSEDHPFGREVGAHAD